MSTRSPINSWVGVLALAGCVSLVELDRTTLDADRDGYEDSRDNCPRDSNPDQRDDDGDGVGNACSDCPAPIGRDDDGDGRDDGCDGCIGAGPSQEDLDGDLLDDGCDPCIFAGTPEAYSPLELDDDNDGIKDGCDACVGQIGVDIDRDGLDDICDACLNGPATDQDHDGIEDGCDNCPVDPNPDQVNDGGEDELGKLCDPDAALHARILFDGFYEAVLDRWEFPPETKEPPYGWVYRRTAAGDHLEQVVATPPLVAQQNLWRSRTKVGGVGSYVIRLRAWFDPAQPTAGELGIALENPELLGGPGIIVPSCSVTRDGAVAITSETGSRLELLGGGVTEPLILQLAAITDGLECVVTCSVPGIGEVTTKSFPEFCEYRSVVLALRNDATISVDWIESVIGR